jgi:predicted RNase H-like HicB family nuclease
MQIPVLIEPIAGNGYRASTGQPPGVVVEAPTREEALVKLKERLQARLRDGAEIVPLDLTPVEHPWMEFAGMFKDDPYFKEIVEIMAANRRKMDRDRKAG